METSGARRRVRVLAVDDEAPVREMISRTLLATGYEVTSAANGAEAAALLTSGATFELVIADLAMPGLTGAELSCRIRSAHPDLKILYVTGFIDSLLDSRQLWEGEAFLEKPFTSLGLREAVSLLLFGTLAPPAPPRMFATLWGTTLTAFEGATGRRAG